MKYFNVGDIVNLVYKKRAMIYSFEGICISKKKKKMLKPQSTIILRNIISGIGIELSISYYQNRVYKSTISDYKRKQFFYKKSKLFYLRQKLNRASRIK